MSRSKGYIPAKVVILPMSVQFNIQGDVSVQCTPAFPLADQTVAANGNSLEWPA